MNSLENNSEGLLSPPKERKGRALLWKLGISTAILFIIFKKVPFSHVIDAVVSAKIIFVFYSVIFQMMARYIMAWRMKILTDQQNISLSLNQIFEIGLSVSFYSLFLPGVLSGGLMRLHRMTKGNKKYLEAFSCLAADRYLDVLSFGVLGIVFLLMDKTVHLSPKWAFVICFFSLCLVFIPALLLSKQAAVFFEKWCSARKTFWNTVMLKFNRLLSTLRKFVKLNDPMTWIVIIFSVVSNLLGIFSFYFLIRALDLPVSFISAGWIRSFVLFSTLIPFTVSGLGIREGALILILLLYGIPPAQATALSFLLLARAAIVGLVGGIYEAKNIFFPAQKAGL